MTEDLEQLLKNLKLRRILEIYDEQARVAEKDDLSYSDFVTRLLRAQWQARQEGALEWRIRRANLPERWTLETFPFARQPGVNRKQIRTFAELEFIAKAENIVLVGETGRGKTGLACGLLLKALENGYRCQFVRAQDLFDEMYASLADRSTRQLLKRLARLDVILIDEFGYLNLKPEQSNIFFKLMEERYRHHSTIITTNLGYDEWPNFLGTRPRVEALLSRLRHSIQRGLSVKVIENALVLAATRRLVRPAEAPPLDAIRSLAYFLPVIEEVLESRISPDYFRYLRHKLANLAPAR